MEEDLVGTRGKKVHKCVTGDSGLRIAEWPFRPKRERLCDGSGTK